MTAFAGMAGLAALGTLLALAMWPRHDPDVIPHGHDELPGEWPAG